jgi:hypothetical protein
MAALTPFGGEEPTSNQGRPGRAAGPFSPKSPRGGRVGQVEPGPIDLAVLGWQGGSDEAPFVACRGLARGWRSSWRWSSRPFGVEMARVGGTAPRFFLVMLPGGTFGCGCTLGCSTAFEPAEQPVTGSLAHLWWVSRPAGAVAYPRRVPRR